MTEKFNPLDAMSVIVTATRAARTRTGNKAIGTRFKAGRVQVVEVTYVGGSPQVKELSEWGSTPEAVRFLDAL